MAHNPLVSIVIIHWNTPDLLKKQLALLKPEENIEIIVVDNFSSTDTSKIVSGFTKQTTHIVLNKENRGFAHAGNIGAALARGTWLLFLNPDVLMSLASIYEFVEAAQTGGLDAASPKTSDPRYMKPLPTPLTLAVEFSPLRRIIPLTMFHEKTLTGGCLLIKKDIFDRIGQWDENFFLWFEDSDLTRRLHNNNCNIGWVDVDAQHVGGASFQSVSEPRRLMLFFTSMNTYARKHFGPTGQRVVSWLVKRHVGSLNKKMHY